MSERATMMKGATMNTIHLGDCLNGCKLCADNHNWVCTDIPANYSCECGATGYWNGSEIKADE